MEPPRWRRLEAVFDEAVLEPKGPARGALVRSRCEGDESLAAEVLAFLNADDRLTSAASRECASVAVRSSHRRQTGSEPESCDSRRLRRRSATPATPAPRSTIEVGSATAGPVPKRLSTRPKPFTV
jgi:hypothetical protein